MAFLENKGVEICPFKTFKPHVPCVFENKRYKISPCRTTCVQESGCCKIFVPQRRSNVLRRDQPNEPELMTKILRSLVGLENVLRYEPDTGKFFWLIDRPRKTKAGAPAGHLNQAGYIEIRYNYKNYQAHRIAWYLHTGKDPHPLNIDHINCKPADNRIVNLRLATPAQNAKNMRKKNGTSSKYKGVTWREGINKWEAQIRVDGENIYLGCHTSELDAHLAYCAAAAELHGEFARFA